MSNRSFYNEILTEHNMHPDFKHPLPDADLVLEGINPTCGDDIFLRLKVDENDNIVDGAYDGDGCAISQASADIMLGLIVGRPREEALHLADIFIRMIKKDASEEEIEERRARGGVCPAGYFPYAEPCQMCGSGMAYLAGDLQAGRQKDGGRERGQDETQKINK